MQCLIMRDNDGPLRFMMYTADVVKIFERQGLSVHQYGNNIQVYSRCRPTDSMFVCRDLGSCIKHVASLMDTNRCKDGIHMVRSTTSASSVSIRSTCSWLCSGDTSCLSMQHVNEVARYQAPVHVLRHPSTDSQHQTIGSTVNTVDTHLQLRIFSLRQPQTSLANSQ